MPGAPHSTLDPLALPAAEREGIRALFTEFSAPGLMRLITRRGRRLGLPPSLQQLLRRLVEELDAGNRVTIVPGEPVLTTAQACRLLGVSRQFFVNLLESDAIPFHKAGKHRRIYLRDLLRYRQARDRQRRTILRRMVEAEADAGLYGVIPADVKPRRRSARIA